MNWKIQRTLHETFHVLFVTITNGADLCQTDQPVSFAFGYSPSDSILLILNVHEYNLFFIGEYLELIFCKSLTILIPVARGFRE